MNLDTNHYLTLLDPKLRAHVGHAKAAFMGDGFIWAEFEIIVDPESRTSYIPVGTLICYPNRKPSAKIIKHDNGRAYRIEGTEADMLKALERATGVKP